MYVCALGVIFLIYSVILCLFRSCSLLIFLFYCISLLFFLSTTLLNMWHFLIFTFKTLSPPQRAPLQRLFSAFSFLFTFNPALGGAHNNCAVAAYMECRLKRNYFFKSILEMLSQGPRYPCHFCCASSNFFNFVEFSAILATLFHCSLVKYRTTFFFVFYCISMKLKTMYITFLHSTSLFGRTNNKERKEKKGKLSSAAAKQKSLFFSEMRMQKKKQLEFQLLQT